MDFGFRSGRRSTLPGQSAGRRDRRARAGEGNLDRQFQAGRAGRLEAGAGAGRFRADWCGPCKQLAPVLEKVVRSYGGKVKLVKLNVDQHPSIPGQLRIQSLPTVYAFRDGRPLDGFMGVQPESGIKSFIDRILGEEGAADVEEALKAADRRSMGATCKARRKSTPPFCRRTSRTPRRWPGSRGAI